LSRASRLDPTNAFYRIMQAEILSSVGRWREVQSLAEQALDLEPRFVEARLLRAQALCRVGLREPAREELEIVRSVEGKLTDRSKPLGYSGLIRYFDEAAYRKISTSVRKGCPPA